MASRFYLSQDGNYVDLGTSLASSGIVPYAKKMYCQKLEKLTVHPFGFYMWDVFLKKLPEGIFPTPLPSFMPLNLVLEAQVTLLSFLGSLSFLRLNCLLYFCLFSYPATPEIKVVFQNFRLSVNT